MWNAWRTPSLAFSTGKALLEKATARTNRDGGVKSPGRPSIPLPWTKPLDLLPGKVDLLDVLVGNRDVVAEVGHVPVEGRRVRHHAEWIGVNLEFAADVFENHTVAGGVGHDEMDRRDEAHVLLHDRPHTHALGGGNSFLHVGACTEQVGAEFPRSECLSEIFCHHFLILGEAR